MPPLPTEAYQVGWVCALPKELTAARAMLDEEHEEFKKQAAQDDNSYVLGRIHDHNVVLACLPAGVYGTVSAATVAVNMLRTFTGIRCGLMVGIGGGIPNLGKGVDIRLGDVVVSQPDGTHGGVVQYDLGKNLGKGTLERKGNLRPPPKLLLTALANLQSRYPIYGNQISDILSDMIKRLPRLAKAGYTHPTEADRLYCSNVEAHQEARTCTQCQAGVIQRQSRDDQSPEVHYGVIASGDQLMKNAVERDRLGLQLGAKCVEMEAAGLMNDFPCIVVRGICDYADSHKNDGWQEYAAATAAAFAKELLSIVKPAEVSTAKHATEVMARKEKKVFNIGSININKYINETNATAEEVKKACLTALWRTSPSLTNPVEDQQKIIDKKGSRAGGTCEWIRENEVYKSWLRSPSGSQALWLSGGPGRGKTMLSIFLAEELTRISEQSQDGTTVVIRYFCNQDKDERRNTAIAIVRSLMHQLLQKHEKLVKHLEKDFELQKETLFAESDSSLRSLWTCFEKSVCDPSLPGIVYCVIDGLDECEPASLEVLLKRLRAFYRPGSKLCSTARFNLIVTSREEPAFVARELADFPRIRLESKASHAHVNSDVGKFIQVKVDELSRSVGYSPQLRAHVLDVFQRRAQGTFLWVGIVARELEKYTSDEVEGALERFPPGLAALYGDMLLQIPAHRRETTAKILRWVAVAVRPLTLSELSAAVGAIAQPSLGLHQDDVIRLQVRNCGSILTVTDVRGKPEVGLIHQSVQDYLLRETCDPEAELEFFRVRRDEAHTEIVKQCLSCLESDAAVITERGQSVGGVNPLLPYAISNWAKHALCVLDSKSEIFHTSHPFYADPPPLARKKWLRAYSSSAEGFGKLVDSSSMLHVASHFGIRRLVERLLDEKVGEASDEGNFNTVVLNQQDVERRTALHLAVRQGHEATVRLLVERGADCRVRDRNGYDALFAAVRVNSTAIVRLLLRLHTGIDVNTHNNDGITALHESVSHGHETMTQLLLANGADPNFRVGETKSALSLAVRTRQEGIVRLLLDSGADLYADGDGGSSGGWALLWEARQSESEATVQLLLERGPKLDASKWDGGAMLHWAANRGYLEVSRLLLRLGADPHAGGDDPVLHEAALNGNEEVVLLLLETGGADPTTKDGYGRTALQLAAGRGLEKAVRVLLARNADPNTEDNQGHIPIHLAVESQREAVVRLLVAHGANINVKNKWGNTALHTAAGRGMEGMVRLLLEVGADPSIKDDFGRTALHDAIGAGEGSILPILLANNPDLVHLGDDCGQTTLHDAASRGKEESVRLLLDGNANPNRTDKWGKTPLHNAAENGNKSIVELLLERGADPSARSVNGSTPLLLARFGGHREICQLLLDDYIVHHLPENEDGWTDLS